MARQRWLASFLVLLAAVGCQRGEPASSPRVAETATSAEQPPEEEAQESNLARFHRGAPVSDEEARQFGREMQQAVTTRNFDQFQELFDWRAFDAIVLDGLPLDDQELQSVREASVKRGNTRIQKVFDNIVAVSDNGGSYEFLSVQDREHGKVAVFRLRHAEAGLNYHELCLVRRPGGVRCVDAYVAFSGEHLSESVRRLIIVALPKEKPDLVSRLIGRDRDTWENAEALKEILAAHTAKDSQRVLRLFRKLPDSLRTTKLMLLMRLLAAANIDNDEYLQAIDDYVELYPNDPSLDLIMLDAYALRRQFTEAHRTVDRIDRAVGGDPYLRIHHLSFYVQEKNYPAAEKLIDELLGENPDDQGVHWLRVSMSLDKRQFDETARLLTEMEGRFGLVFEDLTTIPEYAEFVQSPAYRKWMSRGQPMPAGPAAPEY
jgi:tetratricopeptide (TPR) repeat protein